MSSSPALTGDEAVVEADGMDSSAPRIEPTLFRDDWATYKRVLPRDIYEILRDIERMVATEAEIHDGDFHSLGKSIEVLTIITRFLDEEVTRNFLAVKAREWKADK